MTPTETKLREALKAAADVLSSPTGARNRAGAALEIIDAALAATTPPAPEPRTATVPVALLVYWLRRSLDALRREGWEDGFSAEETVDDLIAVLSNFDHKAESDPLPKMPNPSHYVPDSFPPPRESSAAEALIPETCDRECSVTVNRTQTFPVRHSLFCAQSKARVVTCAKCKQTHHYEGSRFCARCGSQLPTTEGA